MRRRAPYLEAEKWCRQREQQDYREDENVPNWSNAKMSEQWSAWPV